MTKVKPGDRFEVNWPFTDQAGAKRRPAVALGAEDSHYDVELLMVTTQKQHGDCVALADSDYAALPLPKPSFVRITRPLKVRMDRITPLGLQLTIECVARLRRGIILRDTRSFSSLAHRANRPADDPLRAPFVPGKTTARYAGRVFDTNEVEAAISSTLDFWLTAGRYADEFESGLAEFLGVENVLLVNSGSSANLVAFSTLTSPKLKDRRVKPGDEVITVAAGVPHDRGAHHPEPRRAGVRGCRTRHLRSNLRQDRGGAQPENQGGDDRPHHGRALPHDRSARMVRPASALAD